MILVSTSLRQRVLVLCASRYISPASLIPGILNLFANSPHRATNRQMFVVSRLTDVSNYEPLYSYAFSVNEDIDYAEFLENILFRCHFLVVNVRL
jgi:hypothetical protein